MGVLGAIGEPLGLSTLGNREQAKLSGSSFFLEESAKWPEDSSPPGKEMDSGALLHSLLLLPSPPLWPVSLQDGEGRKTGRLLEWGGGRGGVQISALNVTSSPSPTCSKDTRADPPSWEGPLLTLDHHGSVQRPSQAWKTPPYPRTLLRELGQQPDQAEH